MSDNGRVTIIFNQPGLPAGHEYAEAKAVLGVLEAVAAVHEALVKAGYEVSRLPLVPPIERAEKDIQGIQTDLVFNLFEGWEDQPESESEVARLMEKRGIYFTGSSSDVLSLAMDKAVVKGRLVAAGIPTPRYRVLSPETLDTFDLEFPCIVKPRRSDASHGITKESVVYDRSMLEGQLMRLCGRFRGEVLVEELVDGEEFNATVLGGLRLEVLPVSEIVYHLPEGLPHILTYDAKWEPASTYYKGTFHVCPAEVEAGLRQQVAELALDSFNCLGCRGYARVDFRRDRWGRLYVLEVNPNPDIAPDAGAVRQARAAGMSYWEFIERIARIALGEKGIAAECQADAERRPVRGLRPAGADLSVHA